MTEKVNLLYTHRTEPARKETIEDVDFAQMFPGVLNASCGGIEFVRDGGAAPVTRKPVNGGKTVVSAEGRIPTFCNFDYALFGGGVGITIFCCCLRLFGIW